MASMIGNKPNQVPTNGDLGKLAFMDFINTTDVVRTVLEYTATAGQTTFTPSGGYMVGLVDVFVNGAQLQSSDFTATNGSTVTLSTACAAGDDVRIVAWGYFNVANAAPVANPQFSGSSLKLPVVTTAGRPSSPQFGMVLANSTTGDPEWWDPTTSTWKKFAQPSGYSVEYLVVAGGGGGGYGVGGVSNGGGGGGGGLLASSITLAAGTSYTITIGAGGTTNLSGSNSSISTLVTAIGGGGGSYDTANGLAGGSGGGGTGGATPPRSPTLGGSGTSGQGYAGGNGSSTGSGYGGGGGGGAGAVGLAGIPTSTGAGGAGTANSISGSSVTYAGGGGGASNTGIGPGGSGGGGAGGYSAVGSPGTTNTGGGGGGGAAGLTGASGGSGIVIIRYLGSQRGTGGTVTSSGGYTIHTFTSSGTYVA